MTLESGQAEERTPHQKDDLVADLRRIGVEPGGVLLVQSSLSKVGPVDGGVRTVVEALLDVVGRGNGTLVAYTGTPENSLSSPAHHQRTRRLRGAGLRRFLRRMPPFDPLRTRCSPSMGQLSEAIRTARGAIRSTHPQTSFAAIGPLASHIVGTHPLESHLGESSPLGRLYELDAKVLLVGLPSSKFTPYHLAEYGVDQPPRCFYATKVPGPAPGTRRWQVFQGVDLDDRVFPELGAAVQEKVTFDTGVLGDADCFLVPLVPAVDAAANWMTERQNARLRSGSPPERSRRLGRGCAPASLLR